VGGIFVNTKSLVLYMRFCTYTLDSQISAAESGSSTPRIISDDRHNSSIQARTQQKQPSSHDEDVNQSHNGSLRTTKQIPPVQMPICDSEIDEAEEGIESSTKKGQEITHARNDLGEDESNGPDACHHAGPDAPTDGRVAVGVAGFAHDAEIHVFSADVCVDDTNDESGDNDKCKGSLLVCDNSQATECRCRGVLPEVSEPNGWGNDEEESGHAGQNGEGLGEILWLLHLGDESWEENLRDPEEGDIEDGVHAVHPCCAGEREGVGSDGTVGWVVAIVAYKRGFLDADEDEEEKDCHSHAGGWRGVSLCEFAEEALLFTYKSPLT
jgi:hypothetical protein